MSFVLRNFYPIAIPPLCKILMSFMIGIICHSYLLLFLLILVPYVVYMFFAYTKRIHFSGEQVLFLLFMIAGVWSYHYEWRTYNDFYTFVGNKKCTIVGTVVDSNQVIVNNKKVRAITIAIDTITVDDITQKNNKLLLLYRNNDHIPMVGDTISIPDMYCKKPNSRDFQQYQIKEHIVATIFDESVTYNIDHHPQWSLRRWIWYHKQRLLTALENKLSSHAFRLFTSLFLGNRSYIKNELEHTNDQFKTWGISHFLARSGLHLVLFIFVWQAIFSFLPLPFFVKQIIILLLSGIYFLLTWTSAPFTRSFALFVLNKLCWFSKMPFHLLHYLTLVCFIFLLYCPLYLFFLDFQLSFALTFALAWFNQVTFSRASAE